MLDISPQLFALQLMTGIALGAIYALLAIGLSLIFGMLTVVNFAHGAFFMVGAFFGVYFLGLTGNFWFSLLLVPLATGGIGLLCERFLVRPLYGRGIDYPLLLTFGLSYVLIDVMRFFFGIEGMPTTTPALLRGSVSLGFGNFPLYRLFLIGATAAIVLALWLFIEKTRYGLIIRAGSRDAEIVKVLGIDISRVWLLVFGIGTAIAGLSGLPQLSLPVGKVSGCPLGLSLIGPPGRDRALLALARKVGAMRITRRNTVWITSSASLRSMRRAYASSPGA